MDNEFQILILGNDFNQIVDYNTNGRESYLKNFKNNIDSYHFIHKQFEEKYICSLRSLINSFDKLDFSSDQFLDISKVNNVLDDYTNAYLYSIKKDEHYYSDLDLIFRKAQNIIKKNFDDNKSSSSNFNALKFFNIDETLHSRLLIKLLNPYSEHGQGKLFLVEFLKLLEIDSPEKGEWKITAETGRIDILLKRLYPESVIIVENKSNGAIDQQNQLYRYWFQEIYLKTKRVDSSFYIKNRSKYKIIYLPSDFFKYPDIHSIHKPQDENWLKFEELPDKMPIEYEIRTFNDFVVKWLSNCLDIMLPKGNHRMSEYLKQYMEICNNL